MIDVLYVEDNPDDVDIFKRVIGKINQPPTYKVITTGNEAVDYVLSRGNYQTEEAILPKMLLLDLNLPGNNGFEVLQQIRSNAKGRYLPIVVYSTSDNPKDMREAFDLGANAYLVKPGGYREVSDMLQRALDFWLAQKANQ
ncbi:MULTISPECIES: response regulator [unclassified Siphonobacter]|uniref:response regulator n=1 Tax=unclassified Siphonobacter TaxID=2635712 RepID=UPI000CB7283A|nr:MULTISPECIES: response regulator [unclassified Siphonobacter]MDQ1087348.1 CheY-like chemotaxis protein [Siphonobacter sp. SORGH_AS_1065]MDR6193500.1 CheY-like chemotaxis protein [Siphonobacter sp. SORGH_AS_0500]PKK36366.1 response regulator [Siphonobacter sp. SORGH_AS_0500]